MFGFMKREDINAGINEVNATAGAVLLDVRTKDEYRNGHVPGSKHIDVGETEKAASIVGNVARLSLSSGGYCSGVVVAFRTSVL